jgi:zinc protease
MIPTLARAASILIAVATASGLLVASHQAAPPLAQKLPTDPDVTVGTFANGLKYFIRTNPLPEKRAELRLAVNVGSLVEEDDQQGLAHFVEHMAFNGTRNFPKSDIVQFMESIGMRFGPSVNAFTSFDETVYMLQVPTDRPEVLERAMLVLEDWARHVSLDGDEIDKERGVIMEEWRLRRGAAARMQDRQLPILLKGSRYADRLPIGQPDVIQKAPHERLRQAVGRGGNRVAAGGCLLTSPRCRAPSPCEERAADDGTFSPVMSSWRERDVEGRTAGRPYAAFAARRWLWGG